MSSYTNLADTERKLDFRDKDGVQSFSKYQNEIFQYIRDWSPLLASAETISSIAYSDSGVTRSSTSNTTTTSTTSYTGLGESEITATLSTGRKLIHKVRFWPKDGAKAMDYR